MNIAIYGYHNMDTGCPSCNQAETKLVQTDVEKCKEKAVEVYGEGHSFFTFIDRSDVLSDSSHLKGGKTRPAMENMLQAISEGKIDMVVVTYMGALAAEYLFILAFYIFLCQHKVKILTVREGEKITEMLEEALEQYRKQNGIK